MTGWTDRWENFQRQFYKGMEGECQIGKRRSLEKGKIGVNEDFHIICIA